MSSWRTGKINIQCSIDVMQRILLGIAPEWASRIQVSPEGNLQANNKKCNILIPAVSYNGSNGSNTKTANYSDIGFVQIDDKWQVIIKDFYGFNVEAEIKKEYAIQTIKAAAAKKRAKLMVEEDTPKGKRMVLFVPAN